MARRRHWLVLPILLASIAFPSAARADWFGTTEAGQAAVRGMQADEMKKLGDLQPGSAVAAAYTGPFFEYTSIAHCPGAAVGAVGFDDFCPQATGFCATNTPQQGLGPAVRIMRREVAATGAVVPGAQWAQAGITCLPELAPGSTPTLTVAMVLEQFHRTKFALPDLKIQPVGNKTLVNLATFYEVAWNEGGFAPESIDTTTIIGRQVEIRPKLNWVEYHYGDGTSSGRVTDLGGPFPSGGIRHTYTSAGSMQVQTIASYGGEFRVDGGAWIPIRDTVEIQGTPQELGVFEAKAQLVR